MEGDDLRLANDHSAAVPEEGGEVLAGFARIVYDSLKDVAIERIPLRVGSECGDRGMRLTDFNRLTHGVTPFRGVNADRFLTFVSSQLTSLQFHRRTQFRGKSELSSAVNAS